VRWTDKNNNASDYQINGLFGPPNLNTSPLIVRRIVKCDPNVESNQNQPYRILVTEMYVSTYCR